MEVDTVLKPKKEESGMAEADWPIKRGRVVVKEIGAQTKKGGYHMTLIRYKQFALMNKRQFGTVSSLVGSTIIHSCLFVTYKIQ